MHNVEPPERPTENDRRLYELHYSEDLSIPVIAGLEGRSEEWVRSRIQNIHDDRARRLAHAKGPVANSAEARYASTVSMRRRSPK